MKVKLDENLPASLVPTLGSLGHETDSVVGEGLGGHDDESVWDAAQRDGRFLVTQDLDFSDVRRYPPGTHHGVLLIRLVRPRRAALIARISGLFAGEDVDAWAGCHVVATEHKVRIRRPPG